MSNLGLYQSMTTWAKKLGGPLQLFGAVALGGYIVIRTVEAGSKKVIQIVKRDRTSEEKEQAEIYVIHTEGESNEGLQFSVGDQFHILEIVKDIALIEKIGDTNNPYFVSIDLLRSLSNFNG